MDLKAADDGFFGAMADTSRASADQRSNLVGAPPTPDYADFGMENIAPGTSIFDPVLAESMYRWFCPPGGTILDPFAGGSVRGIVASRLGHPYIGIDLSEKQVLANREQAAEICRPTDPAPVWIVGNSLDVTEHLAGAGVAQVDMVFSCPPYYDLEIYSEDPADLSNADTYEDFRMLLTDILCRSVAHLKAGRFAAMVVSEVRGKKAPGHFVGLVPDTVRALDVAGARFYNEVMLLNMAGTAAMRAGKQMRQSRKVVRVHQNVIVGLKGGIDVSGWSHGRESLPSPQATMWGDE